MIERDESDIMDYHQDSRMHEADDKLLHYYFKMVNPSFDEEDHQDQAAIMNEVIRLSIARQRRGIPGTENFSSLL